MSAVSPILRLGIFLTALAAGMATLSHAFPYGTDVSETPLELYIGLALGLGGLWACLPRLLNRSAPGRPSVVVILMIGLVMRGAMFVSLPVLEDDSYRYLWDGAVTAHGIDPYKYAPAQASPVDTLWAESDDAIAPDLSDLQALADAHPVPHARINYPYVSTIYPPLAQAAFAIAHVIDPFGMTGWRLVLLAADLVTFWLLLLLLRTNGRDPLWSSLYWWNPVVILQGFGAGHMDLLLVPFMLGALSLAQRQKQLSASVALAGAAAVKLWPILLFPLIARPLLRQPSRLAVMTGLFMATTAFALLPQLLHALRPEAGLNAYASEWRTHAFIFAIFEDVLFAAFDDPGQLARACVAGIMILLTAVLAWRFANQSERLPVLAVIVVAALIILSPTGYPWYLIWLAPLLVLVPHPALLCLTALTPLYWLRFQLGDESIFYQWGVVPIAFGVPLLLLLPTVLNRSSDRADGHHYSSIE